jgi:hypothetical protein
MNTHKLPHGIVRNALGVADKMEPLPAKKDPVIAAFAGFVLGGVGLGAYLRTWPDFFIPCLILLTLMVLSLPLGGLPMFFAPFFMAIYGYRRVKASNDRLKYHDGDILDAEIVTSPPAPAQSILPPSSVSTKARLLELDALFRAGLISQTERDSRRASILAGL